MITSKFQEMSFPMVSVVGKANVILMVACEIDQQKNDLWNDVCLFFKLSKFNKMQLQKPLISERAKREESIINAETNRAAKILL